MVSSLNIASHARAGLGCLFGTGQRCCVNCSLNIHRHVCIPSCLKIRLLLQSMPYTIISCSHYSSPAEKRRPSSRASKIHSKTSIRGTRRSNFSAKSECGCFTLYVISCKNGTASKSNISSSSCRIQMQRSPKMQKHTCGCKHPMHSFLFIKHE